MNEIFVSAGKTTLKEYLWINCCMFPSQMKDDCNCSAVNYRFPESRSKCFILFIFCQISFHLSLSLYSTFMPF